MRQNFFAVLNSSSPNVGEIKIYGVIGSYWDENTANDFVRVFSNLEKTCDRINIHINSPGGNVHEGLPICNAIKASKTEVHTYVDGIAYSMGAMIAISAKKGRVHMAKGSLLMLHSVSTWMYGNAQALRDEADVLDKYDDVLGGLIAVRTGKEMDAVKADYMDHKDHYFTPAEAVAEGLVDFVEDYEAEDMPDNVQDMSHGQIAAWYDAQMEEPSEGMLAKLTSRLKSAFGKQINNDNMFGDKFSKLGALAKVAVASITAAQLEDINAQIKEAKVEGVTVVLDSELETVRNENVTLAADKTALETAKSTLEASIATKDARITALEAEVAALKGKPASESGTPEAKGDDNIPEGGKEKKDEFRTSVDDWARRILADE
ncbi:Clp protease ClpP [Sphingobacterium alkalisoli]|uniref:ATP-dependent Clp protease proteolytic subunit n=1 Tax=Sphingobacterium alkalisoli TaxID=1874115 RepID=A0A4U0GVT9_9SPHI|nr:head maturation protease, ClpP-related [Sphingobacterium alkalisoli]TJY62704.1 Clp protease ClpP [Sphingobacterium alkalisoli]GGH28324.1 hypothetical protein GCM10011418_38900 [Sphingobacterium alkalisoli]